MSGLAAGPAVDDGEPAAWGGTGFLLVGLALLPLGVRLVQALAPRGEHAPARWKAGHLAAVLLSGFAVRVAIEPLVRDAGVFLQLLLTELVLGGAALTALFLAHRTQPAGVAVLGLAGRGAARAFAAGGLAYPLLAPAFLVLFALWGVLLQALGHEPEPQPVLVELSALDGRELALALPFAVLLGPFLEELLFRGFLQPACVQKLGARAGIALTSVLFAFMHLSLAALVPIFALSLLLGWLRLRTAGLWAPWAAHCLHNGLMLALALAQRPE